MRSTETKKATFNLPRQLLDSIGDVVTRGVAPNKNAFVEQALESALRAARAQLRRQAWAEAARDPLFRRDIEQVEEDFRAADAETAREIV